jgi:hypothetical protein
MLITQSRTLLVGAQKTRALFAHELHEIARNITVVMNFVLKSTAYCVYSWELKDSASLVSNSLGTSTSTCSVVSRLGHDKHKELTCLLYSISDIGHRVSVTLARVGTFWLIEDVSELRTRGHRQRKQKPTRLTDCVRIKLGSMPEITVSVRRLAGARVQEGDDKSLRTLTQIGVRTAD